MAASKNDNSILSKYDLEYIDLTDANYMTDRTSVQSDYLSKKGFPDNLVYNMCNDKSPSLNPYFCSLWSMKNDPFDCSPDYIYKTSCTTSYNTYTNCGSKLMADGNATCIKSDVVDDSNKKRF